MPKEKVISKFNIIIVTILSVLLLFSILKSTELDHNIAKLTIELEQTKKELDITLDEINEYDVAKIISNEDIDTIYSTYDSNFLKHATGSNSPLFRIPNSKSKKIGIVDDTVLIYNTYQVTQNTGNIEVWAYVEYVGENTEDIGADDCGYMLLSDLTLLNNIPKTYTEIGIGGIYIGDRYENVIARFGVAKDLIKDDYKEWYVYHPQYYLRTFIDPKTICVDRMILEKPSNYDLLINEELSSKTKWDEFISYFEKESIDFAIIDSGETERLEGYFNNEIKLVISHWKGEFQIEFIEIVEM